MEKDAPFSITDISIVPGCKTKTPFSMNDIKIGASCGKNPEMDSAEKPVRVGSPTYLIFIFDLFFNLHLSLPQTNVSIHKKIFISFNIQKLAGAWNKSHHCITKIFEDLKDLMDFESCLSLCKVLNLEVGQCALFISKHAKMKSLKRILFVCLVLTFLTLLSCMLLRSPGRSQLLVTRMTSEKNKESSRSAQLEENRNLKHFFIFDAFAYSNGLGFLDGLSTRWEILVVNLADRGQLKSCRRCQVVKESWTQKFLAAEMSSATWKQLQGYGKEKIVAILYALLNSAEWLYVTDSQFLPDEDSLLSVCVNKVTNS